VTKRESYIRLIKKLRGDYKNSKTPQIKKFSAEFFPMRPLYNIPRSAMRAKNKPYWNFWKVVFAGWLIRYPDKVFRIIGIPLGILIVVIYNAVTK
jgi:hypothetical protein